MVKERARQVALINTARTVLSAAGAGAVVAAGTANPALAAVLVASGAKLVELTSPELFLPRSDRDQLPDLREPLWELGDLALERCLQQAEDRFPRHQRDDLRRLSKKARGFHRTLLFLPLMEEAPTASEGAPATAEHGGPSPLEALLTTDTRSPLPFEDWEALLEELAYGARVPLTRDLKTPLAHFLASSMQAQAEALLRQDITGGEPLHGKAWAVVLWLDHQQRIHQDRPSQAAIRDGVHELLHRQAPDSRWLQDPRVQEGPDSEADRLAYRREFDRFLGREPDLEAVRQALALSTTDEPVFRWSILSGSAGTGKSRLALELYIRSEQWPCRGFAIPGAVSRETARTWRTDHPSLIIVDYAGHKEGVAEFIQTFAHRARAGDLSPPVRILLVERRSDDPNLEQIFTGELRAAARQYQGPGHRLGPLDEAVLVQIMRERIQRTEGTATSHGEGWSDARLLEALDYHDRRRRPLYAALVGDAIANDYFFSATSERGALTRGRLFERLLEREREEVWKLKDREATQYENLLLLTTFTGGFDNKDLEELYEQPTLGLDLPEDPDFGTYARVAMTHAAQVRKRLPPLEPDLLGERLVLQALLPENEGSLGIKRRNRWLRRLAWKNGREDTASFVQKCFDNYPEDVFRLGWLLPESESLELELLAPFIASMLWLINAASGDSPPSSDAEDMVLDLLDRLDERLGAPDDPSRFDHLSSRVAGWTALAYSYAARCLGARFNGILLNTEPPALLSDFPAPRKPLTTIFNPSMREDGESA
ncbi:MAG: hypothetical protein SX243_15255 [Acidobacteriota bacterium]|nr:hypothetical protein [Acidobacteriota bacterium]